MDVPAPGSPSTINGGEDANRQNISGTFSWTQLCTRLWRGQRRLLWATSSPPEDFAAHMALYLTRDGSEMGPRGKTTPEIRAASPEIESSIR